MKKILIGGVVVIGVVAVAGAVAVNYLLDGETIAQELQKEAKTRLNRHLTFAAPINIKLFPKVAIELPATTLSYANSDKAQLTLNSASAGVMLLPLFKGEVKLDTIKVDGLKGKVNLQRLKAALDKKQSNSSSPSSNKSTNTNGLGFIKDLTVHGIDVFDSALTVYGLQNQKVYTLENVNFSTGPIALRGETNVRLTADFLEKTQNLQGHIGFDSQLVYDMETLAVSLEKVAAHVALNPAGDELKLQLTTPKMAYSNGDLSVKTLKLQASGPHSLAIDTSMTLSSMNGMTLWRVDDWTGTAKAAVGNRLATVPFAGKVQADTLAETVAFTLTGELEKSPFTIQAQSIGFAKPGMTGRVAVDRLTVEDWLPKVDEKVALGTLSPMSNAWAQDVADLSVLTKADANIAINVGQVKYRALEVNNVSADLVLQKGKLSLRNAKAQTCGGSMASSFTIDQGANWTVSMDGGKVSTQCVASGLGVMPILEGVASVKVALNGTGLESVAVKKTVNGTVTADVQNAVLKGISLEKVAGAVREKNLAGLIANRADETSLQALSLKATVKNGEVCLTNLTGKSAVAEVSGQANVSLLTQALSGTIKAKLATSVDGRRVTVPIALGGTISEPNYQLDVGEALKEQVKEELKNPDLLLKGLNKLFNR